MRNASACTVLISVLTLSSLCLGISSVHCKPSAGSSGKQLIAAKTKKFEEKQGFERNQKDIMNTLKDNDVNSFNNLIDALQRAYGLDKTLKEKGPFTLFAPTDRAFDQFPQDDLQSLLANQKKLKQVLSYHIVKGEISGKDLRGKTTVKTLEGHDLAISQKAGDLYADKALIRTTDIPCSNGLIHVIDNLVMPPSGK